MPRTLTCSCLPSLSTSSLRFTGRNKEQPNCTIADSTHNLPEMQEKNGKNRKVFVNISDFPGRMLFLAQKHYYLYRTTISVLFGSPRSKSAYNTIATVLDGILSPPTLTAFTLTQITRGMLWITSEMRFYSL